MRDSLSLLKNACAYIEAGNSRGTGYLVSSEHVITCEHVVRGIAAGGELRLRFPAGERSARVKELDAGADWALLELDQPLTDVWPLRLAAECPRGAPWEAYGFPATTGTAGVWLTGDVQDPNGDDPQGHASLVLFSREVAAGSGGQIQGISGTPVLVGGTVVGHIKRIVPDDSEVPRAQLGLLYACSARELEKLIPSRPARSHLKPASGAFDPSWYINRKLEEDKAFGYAQTPGAPVVLWGPEGFGKTWLLKYLIEQICREDKSGARVAQVNLGLIDHESRHSLDAFLAEWATQMVDDLGLPESFVEDTWRRKVGPLRKMTNVLKQILHAVPGNLFIPIDRADAVLGLPFQDDFFGMLRSWAENGDREPFSRVRLLLTISTTPALLVKRAVQSPFNMTDPILLPDFKAPQIMELAHRYGMALHHKDMSALMSLVGGHPYLVRQAMHAATLEGRSIGEIIKPGADAAVFEAHLDRCAQRLRRHPEAFEAFRLIVRNPKARPDRDTTERLKRAGLVIEDEAGLRARYHLYEKLAS
jgi:AAA-like domain/Trypsin-like peptidase domain